MTGPLSIANYTKHALIHPLGGYYTRENVFGTKGDFITSPEISQIFGELIAIWIYFHWKMQPFQNFRLIELGPGRGTLMADILRTLSQYEDFYNNMESVNLVEASKTLQKKQNETLQDFFSSKKQEKLNKKVVWHEFFNEIPKDITSPSIIIAHEFFDALPIFKFQYTKNGWREILVDIKEEIEDKNSGEFRFVLAPGETQASISLTDTPRFDAEKKVGNVIEVSAESFDITREIASRINENGGFGLIFDYGKDNVSNDSLRGVSNHKFVSILKEPGSCDITADVDFSLLKSACSHLAFPYGPITQKKFLETMGIYTRLGMLLKKGGLNSSQRKSLVSGVKRLTSLENNVGMGNIYKVLAITNNQLVPYSFDSDETLVNETRQTEGLEEEKIN